MADQPSTPAGADESLRKVLAVNVVRLRTARGWSQHDLAREAGFERSYIAHVERGVKNITLDNLERLAVGLRVAVHKLLIRPR
jgi:transcriptional regulator with XRE-family HTH domain